MKAKYNTNKAQQQIKPLSAFPELVEFATAYGKLISKYDINKIAELIGYKNDEGLRLRIRKEANRE